MKNCEPPHTDEANQELHDVREALQKAKESLRESEERNRLLVQNLSAGVVVHAPDSSIIFSNPMATTLLGLSSDQMSGKAATDPDWHFILENGARLPLAEYPVNRVLLSGTSLTNHIVGICHPDRADIVWVQCNAYPVFSADGTLLRVVVTFHDISGLKRAQAELITNEARFRFALEAANTGMWDLDLVNHTAYRSLQHDRIFGYQELLPEWSYEMFQQHVLPEDRDEVDRKFRTAIKEQSVWDFECRIVRSDGIKRWIRVCGHREFDTGGISNRMIGIVKDITERKLAEEERNSMELKMLQTQKLESLGVLAGGIAHDFNNILMAIMGNADLALMRINPESPVVENLQRVEQAAARAADLVKQMLAYSGKGKFIVEYADVSRLVEEMLHIMEVSISKKAVLRFNLTSPIPSVEADITQLRQIIMNLVINASEAIGDKSGVIAINTGCMECDKNYLRSVWLNENLGPGLYVYLEVSDTGCGMDDETLSKLFDPFFTTKFTGRGLGMSAVLGIVRGHKGAIRVYSEAGKGSSFKILLPTSDRPADIFNGACQTGGWKGTGTVLLVDDEETVRAIGSEMLRELGFLVVTAQDGREAVEVFKTRDDVVIVILDLTMPHMDGEQCFRELRRLKADLKVIMSSGFNQQEVTQRFVGKGLSGFIQKPYRLSVLRDVIKEL
jgi:PAS domain S-box-containing protein